MQTWCNLEQEFEINTESYDAILESSHRPYSRIDYVLRTSHHSKSTAKHKGSNKRWWDQRQELLYVVGRKGWAEEHRQEASKADYDRDTHKKGEGGKEIKLGQSC